MSSDFKSSLEISDSDSYDYTDEESVNTKEVVY